jgi:FkbM family methyltransferase
VWRVIVVKALGRGPSWLRRVVFRSRRAVARVRRRRMEARGDYSASYPALNEMDRQLERYLPEQGGFFVEAGGNDGYTQSNTYALERRRGWRGVLVEPVPELARACALERPGSRVVRAALVAEGFPLAEVSLRFGGLMTVVVGGRKADEEWVAAAHAVGQEEPPHEFVAPARTLSSILDEVRAPEVDLLSLDVEGYEAQALAGLDLERHAPRFVLVEMRDTEADRGAIEAILGERYIDVDALSPFDILYARADVADAAGLTDRARR